MLAGKSCIVTGSTAGIGKGITRSFLKEGAFVFVNGRSQKSVSAALDSLAEEGFTQTLADISTAEGTESFFAEVEASGREVDILVNNMGIFEVRDFFETTDEIWTNYFNTNVLSTVRMSRKYLKPMLERNKGRIIIVSSESGIRPNAGMINYASTKATQVNIARGLAELTKGTNVTVNSLLVGPTSTEGLTTFFQGAAEKNGVTEDQAVKAFFDSDHGATSLLQRFLTVEEVANVTLFLASDLSSGINGAAQKVEGGIVRST